MKILMQLTEANEIRSARERGETLYQYVFLQESMRSDAPWLPGTLVVNSMEELGFRLGESYYVEIGAPRQGEE